MQAERQQSGALGGRQVAHRQHRLGEVLHRFGREGVWNQLCRAGRTDRGRRTNAIDRNVGVEQLGGHALGEPVQRGFHRPVDHVAGSFIVFAVRPHRSGPGHRTDVDDPPGTLLSHTRHRRLRQDEGHAKIVLDRAVEGLQRHVLDQRVVGEARVVHQDVDAAGAVKHGVDQAIARVGLLEVGGQAERRTSSVLDQGHGFVDGARQHGGRARTDGLRRCVTSCGHRHGGAFCGQPLCDRPADAPAATGY